jgi:endonuclease/exonuclease/phosphatase family metal-dependent hydrolase
MTRFRFGSLSRPGRLCVVLMAACALAYMAATAPTALAWQADIKVMSYNIRKGLDSKKQKALAKVQQVVAGQLPDLLAVQEIDQKDVGPLARASGFAHHAAVRAYGKEDWRPRLGVFSRWPMTVEVLPLANSKRSFAKAVIDVQGIPLVFYVAHFSRQGLVDGGGKGLIKEVLGLSSRSEQMNSVVKNIKSDRHRYRILAGDLNTFPMSGPYRQLSEVMQDAFHDTFGKGTYRVSEIKSGKYKDMPSPKIDHIFHGQGLQTIKAYVVEQGPSDHFPVAALLAMKVPNTNLGPAEIKRAQSILQALGLGPKLINGDMDPSTRRSIARFQKARGLTIDGVLNPDTWSKLRQAR